MSNAMELNTPNDKKRKRPRAARACEFCRAKKYRCDELYPCSQCKRQKVECVYEGIEHIQQRMLSSSHGNYIHHDSTVQQREPLVSPASAAPLSEQAAQPRRDYSHGTPIDTLNRARSQDAHAEGQGRGQSTVATVLSRGSDAPNADIEITNLNQHTRSIEFHGKTSSLAFLSALNPSTRQTPSGGPATIDPAPTNEPSIVSNLYNNAFSPDSLTPRNPADYAVLDADRYQFRHAHYFLEGHWQTSQVAHPILDKASFVARCEDLWFGHAERQSLSFVALYYSVMSLGALMRPWDEGSKLDGFGRFEWSRKFFGLANTAVRSLQLNSDIETVQCYFFMAKICQNELNLSFAYTYLGYATRACFSAGYNRDPTHKDDAEQSISDAITRTWWGLYSIEIEISFALGRPDSLGSDKYHNRRMLPLDDTETAMIPAMVLFARITRKVCTSIYLLDDPLDTKIAKALQIEHDMDDWISRLPETIRPRLDKRYSPNKIMKEPLWARRQRLVLELRYNNVKMVLFKPFLITARDQTRHQSLLAPVIEKCLNAGRNTINLVHEVYIDQTWFRTWWYNATYVLYAASIVLSYAVRVSDYSDVPDLLALGDKAVDILEAMDESIVARNASKMLKQVISRTKDKIDHRQHRRAQDGMTPTEPNILPDRGNGLFSVPDYDDNIHGLNLSLDFFDLSFPLDGTNMSFWPDSDILPGMS